ncbi:MAG: hypothetical protein Q9196_001841 [Gyalolechia fulgens]
MTFNNVSPRDRESFTKHLQKSYRILALCGAGLSAASGLPTFRGAGGIWRNHEATSLATPEAFADDPALVWQFYSYRRHMALNARPNPAHLALAKLARKRSEFVTLTQNVDGWEHNNFTDPIVPALAIPKGSSQLLPSTTDVTGAEASRSISDALKGTRSTEEGQDLDLSDVGVAIPNIPIERLPRCPECQGLLRPDVVWFGEALSRKTMAAVDDFVEESKIDLMLVIGTSARVFPAASYVEEARRRGARVAVFNMDKQDGEKGLTERDWLFHGDSGVLLPALLKPLIGDLAANAPESSREMPV